MRIDNPKVTLADEARNGVKEEVRSGFLDWLYEFNVEGDDGELYAFGGSIDGWIYRVLLYDAVCKNLGRYDGSHNYTRQCWCCRKGNLLERGFDYISFQVC